MKFAHPSEKIFSEHLDLFDIEWIYEPISFPLEWGSGSIKKMFTPDFYLPALDLFVEITTMNQNLISKKRKKIIKMKKDNCFRNFFIEVLKIIKEKKYSFYYKRMEQDIIFRSNLI